MLQDRSYLLNHEIEKLQSEAASLYRQIAINGNNELHVQYSGVLERLNERKAELDSVKALLAN